MAVYHVALHHFSPTAKSVSHLQPLGSNHTPNHTPSIPSSSSAEEGFQLSELYPELARSPLIATPLYPGRRHTLSHHPSPPDFSQYPETRADIQWALNRGDRTGVHKEKQITVYHNVSGQVIEATGLKGELGVLDVINCYYGYRHHVYLLDHMELYVKVRLNTRPSYQRQHKFGRGPVVHKTRVLRGSHSPQWREDFMVGGALVT